MIVPPVDIQWSARQLHSRVLLVPTSHSTHYKSGRVMLLQEMYGQQQAASTREALHKALIRWRNVTSSNLQHCAGGRLEVVEGSIF